MNAFPAYFPLLGRRVIVVGSGEAADGKAKLFAGSPAELIRIGEEQPRAYETQTYVGAALVFIATASEATDARAAAAARTAHVPVNVVDRPALCDFYTPAVVDRGDVVVAIGTSGNAPALSAMLRESVEGAVPKTVAGLATVLGRLKADVRAALPDYAERRAFLRAAIEGPGGQAALQGDLALAEVLMREAMDAARKT